MDKSAKFQHIKRVVDFVANGNTLSAAGKNDPIARSWLRCAHTYRLDPTQTRMPQFITSTKLREHQERIDEFLRVARSGMEQLYKQVAALGYVLLLSDSEGVTVDFIVSPGPQKELKTAGVYIGAHWSEDQMGTSGIGIAIAEKTPLICHQQDHFDANFIDLSCTAAPIFDPQGELLAVLNISTLASPRPKESQYLALRLTIMHAKAIEDANFVRHFGDQWILKLGRVRAFAEINSEMMLAFNDDGVIVGADSAARRGLTVTGCAADALIGSQLPEVFQCTMDDIWCLTRGASVEKSLMTADSQNLYYVAVRQPIGAKESRIISQDSGIISQTKLIKEQQRLEDYPLLDALAGDDLVMQHTLTQAIRLVNKKVNILIQGETGTGKEVLARALHESSGRERKAFVALNCAASPESRVESELFGYAAGAFTGGSSKGMKGLILQSDGGTLFLDEIGDMPVHLQTRLLRVLSENEVMPLGGGKPIPVDLTVISASHRDLRTMLAEQRFREDLYYRICFATLHLPPLRERGDIDFLIDRVAKLEFQRIGFEAQIAPDALSALKEYSWPGNIRELRNAVRVALAVSEDALIRRQDLPLEIQQSKAADQFSLSTPSATQDGINLQVHTTRPSQASEGGHLLAVLRKNKWNVTAAAAEIRVSRVTIYRRMKRFGIVSPNQDF